MSTAFVNVFFSLFFWCQMTFSAKEHPWFHCPRQQYSTAHFVIQGSIEPYSSMSFCHMDTYKPRSQRNVIVFFNKFFWAWQRLAKELLRFPDCILFYESASASVRLLSEKKPVIIRQSAALILQIASWIMSFPGAVQRVAPEDWHRGWGAIWSGNEGGAEWYRGTCLTCHCGCRKSGKYCVRSC